MKGERKRRKQQQLAAASVALEAPPGPLHREAALALHAASMRRNLAAEMEKLQKQAKEQGWSRAAMEAELEFEPAVGLPGAWCSWRGATSWDWVSGYDRRGAAALLPLPSPDCLPPGGVGVGLLNGSVP